MFKRILIANRGEIALRVIRACRSLGVSPVCVYSLADKNGPWIEQADESVCIGPPASKDSYLRIERLIAMDKAQRPREVAAIMADVRARRGY